MRELREELAVVERQQGDHRRRKTDAVRFPGRGTWALLANVFAGVKFVMSPSCAGVFCLIASSA